MTNQQRREQHLPKIGGSNLLAAIVTVADFNFFAAPPGKVFLVFSLCCCTALSVFRSLILKNWLQSSYPPSKSIAPSSHYPMGDYFDNDP
jgi:hypothetical protein